MKKMLVFVVMFTTVLFVNAQSSKVVAAFNYLKVGKLDKAKASIDEAIANPKSMGEAKTWFYYGNTYLSIQLSEEEKYKSLDPEALEKAYDGYKKALELDTKEEYKNDIMDRVQVCAEQFYNKGVNLYNQEKYIDAMKAFGKSAAINNELGRVDTLATYNAALCAELSGLKNEAKTNYLKLVQLNYDQPAVYGSLSEIYKSEGDTVQALNYLAMGRKKYPDNFNLLIAETNIYLATGKKEKALELLKLAITKDDKNPTIFFAVGTNYDQMGNFAEAEKAYQKAIELKPAYFDANYNLGALYVNKAIEIMDDANKLPLNEEKKYNEMKGEADALLSKSLPYLEKADELQPNDQYTLRTLKDIYTRLGMADKLKAVNERIEQK